MEGVKFIESIRLENILSYGPNSEPFPLEPLNVLIGPNGSGKSNFMEVLFLLASAPRDLQEPIREGGGVGAWPWKGTHRSPTVEVEVTLKRLEQYLRYRISFTEEWGQFKLVDEQIDGVVTSLYRQDGCHHFYRYQEGKPILFVNGENSPRNIHPDEIRKDQSILAQRRDPSNYPELWHIGYVFSSFSFYRDWNLGHSASPRFPQRPDSYQDVLLRDSSNLALVLNNLLNQPLVRQELLQRLSDLFPSFHEVTTSLVGGALQIFFHEKGLVHPVPASRLSDGSLRFLSLLAVLCNPKPPLVTCIEEPELGLHPDIIPEIASLLVEASSRSQIFVTTHSDILVDALSDTPEAVVVCEKPEGATRLHRLDSSELGPWLEDYRLGQLWTRGEIGGTRW